MTITIEVVDEAGGVTSAKRTVIHSNDYGSTGELEAAVIRFIRASQAANQRSLEDHHSGPCGSEVAAE
ncbi:MAG TPA: hypothetical protein VGE67_11420 [Haloferula sp.]